jgi:GAF domain
VVEAAAQLLATDGAGLMLADQARVLRWVTATGEAERAFERAQRDLGEGPCIDAFLLDQVVWTADLRVDPRWPRLGPAARDNQIRGVLSAPVSLAGRVLGTCNVITWTSRAWTEAETKSVGSFTTLIGRLLGATSEARHNGDLVTQLQGAKRTMRRGRSTPPRRAMRSRRFRPSSRSWRLYGNSFKARDCRKASTSDGLKPLTCRFAPPAGLEPAPYGLEVRHDPSAWCDRGASTQVKSSPSDQFHLGRPVTRTGLPEGLPALARCPRFTPTPAR